MNEDEIWSATVTVNASPTTMKTGMSQSCLPYENDISSAMAIGIQVVFAETAYQNRSRAKPPSKLRATMTALSALSSLPISGVSESKSSAVKKQMQTATNTKNVRLVVKGVLNIFVFLHAKVFQDFVFFLTKRKYLRWFMKI